MDCDSSRRAQDLTRNSAAPGWHFASTADSGTVGGSADDHLLFFARLVEQNVDIPVPHGRGRFGGRLLGLHPGQSSTAFGGAEHFPAVTAEHIVDIPVLRGGRDLPSSASSSGLPGMANQWVFCTFPRGKKVRGWFRTRSRNWPRTRAHPRDELMARV